MSVLTLKEYKEAYPSLLEKYLNEHEDYCEYTFLQSQIKLFHRVYEDGYGLFLLDEDDIFKQHYAYLSDEEYLERLKSDKEFEEHKLKHNTSTWLIIEFLYQKIEEFDGIKTISKNDDKSSELEPELENDNQQLEWIGSGNGASLEFTELVKALFLTNAFKPLNQTKPLDEKGLHKILSKLILVKNFHSKQTFDGTLSSNNTGIRKRTIDKTIYLDKLSISIIDWIKKLDEDQIKKAKEKLE